MYRSLLTIYNAQVKSLLQQRPEAAPSPEDILAISLEKGGTSVLADGYLVAGSLEPADEEFCFGFGTFLQLADDLQDIAEDSRCGHRTLFSDGAGKAPLDATALRLESYLAAVLERARRSDAPGRAALCDVIGPGLALMFRESVGKQPEYFRRGFFRAARGPSRCVFPTSASCGGGSKTGYRPAATGWPTSTRGWSRSWPCRRGPSPSTDPGRARRAGYLAMDTIVAGSRLAFQATGAALALSAGLTVPVIASPETFPS